MDVSKLLLPYEPDEVVSALAHHKATAPDFAITHLHIFPLGGIKTAAEWAQNRGAEAVAAAQAKKKADRTKRFKIMVRKRVASELMK